MGDLTVIGAVPPGVVFTCQQFFRRVGIIEDPILVSDKETIPDTAVQYGVVVMPVHGLGLLGTEVHLNDAVPEMFDIPVGKVDSSMSAKHNLGRQIGMAGSVMKRIKLAGSSTLLISG